MVLEPSKQQFFNTITNQFFFICYQDNYLKYKQILVLIPFNCPIENRVVLNDLNLNHLNKINEKWENFSRKANIWYKFCILLHFQYYENTMSRMNFKGLIETNLKPVLGEEFRYEKNSEQMYALLKEYGSQEDAIRNAKRLAERFDGR